MSQRLPARAALFLAMVFAPLLALGACDQAAKIWRDATGGAQQQAGPTDMNDVALDARAISGSIQAQSDIEALLAPEPVLIAPGQILVGAQVEQQLDDTARAMGLASNFVQSLRANGEDALSTLPQNLVQQVRARAEQEASSAARDAARDVLARMGVPGAVEVSPGGVLRIDLTEGASPTSLHFAQQAETQAAAAPGAPPAVEYNATDRCPVLTTEAQLKADLALATRCAIQRLQSSRRFEYVEPNFIAASGFSLPPRRTQPAQPSPQQNPAPPSQPAPQQPTSNTPNTNPAPTTPSAPATPQTGGEPNDPLLNLQWDYRPRGTGPGKSPGGAGFISYWQANQIGSRNVRVAVIDTGIDLTHPEIQASHNVVAGMDMITNPERSGDNDGVDADAQDAGDHCGTAEDSFHGTHVAGTIGAAATNDRVGVAGAAWNVTIIPVRVLGRCGGELADIVSGIRWAAGVAPAIIAGQQVMNQNPADIINMSLSIQAPCPASMQSAIDAAVARGSVVVVAAGNKADQAAKFAPANCNNVVVVGAEDARGGLAFYSNFGPQVDILAPGGDVFQDSDGDGRPDGVLSTRTTQSGCYDPLNQSSTTRCYYSYLQGTSMAAPHVSAALALIAAETGLRGTALEDALFTRAIAPLPNDFGQIACAQSKNATPISAGSATCARPSGRGALDLTRAAASIAPRPPG